VGRQFLTSPPSTVVASTHSKPSGHPLPAVQSAPQKLPSSPNDKQTSSMPMGATQSALLAQGRQRWVKGETQANIISGPVPSCSQSQPCGHSSTHSMVQTSLPMCPTQSPERQSSPPWQGSRKQPLPTSQPLPRSGTSTSVSSKSGAVESITSSEAVVSANRTSPGRRIVSGIWLSLVTASPPDWVQAARVKRRVRQSFFISFSTMLALCDLRIGRNS